MALELVDHALMELPPEPDAELIHDRTYTVRAYRESTSSFRLRGIVTDLKPAGLYFAGDPEPLPVHHMVVDLLLEYPTLKITDVEVTMDVTPHSECVEIESTYQQLVGLSIARGFNRKLKELFVGPLGCTHIGALLQAMAPVAVQTMWSMRMLNEREGVHVTLAKPDEDEMETRKRSMTFNINSCHMWEEDGRLTQAVMSGEPIEVPVWAVKRLGELGLSEDEWASF